ncbi:MAG TPA: tetratricopeptide repeat protein [Vicinamibacterales bacterium]|nr:tetratricopeptide repeat protein [Vicinamibacterales bacterium]
MKSALLLAALLLAAPCLAQTSDPRIALMERAAWDALSRGDARGAADIFKRALASDPNNAQLHFGAASAAFADRRDDDAKSELDRALGIDGKLATAQKLLGQVLHRKGDLLGAIRSYETLLLNTPGDAAVSATLDRWRREFDLQLRMQQTYGDHFAVSFDGPAVEEMATRAVGSLNRAFDRICSVLNTYPTTTIPVVLYSTQQFTDITRAPSWAAGAYDGTIRIPMRGALDDEAEFDRVLAHEFTHALIHTLSTPAIPTWLNEGLATALETDTLEWAEKTVAASQQVPLSVLRRGFGQLSGAQARLAYATSALAVRRMLQEAGGFAVANLIRDLGDGVDFDTAFSHRIQRSFDDFQASITQ